MDPYFSGILNSQNIFKYFENQPVVRIMSAIGRYQCEWNIFLKKQQEEANILIFQI